MPRTVIVPQGSPTLQDPTTRVLNTYPDGSKLVRTDAAADEVGPGETTVRTGVRLGRGNPDDVNTARVRLGGGHGDVPAASELERAAFAAQMVLAYVEFAGPVDSRWLTRLKELEVTPLRYHPENSYLCRASRQAFRLARAEPYVQDVTELTAGLKPTLDGVREAGEDVLIVAQSEGEESGRVLVTLRQIDGVEVKPDPPPEQAGPHLRVRATVTAAGLEAALRLPLVVSIEKFVKPRSEDEVADLILAGQFDGSGRPSGSYLSWLESHGLNGRGVAIGIVDGGVDASHPAFTGRLRDLLGGRKDWHGTFVAGHAAGAYLAEKDGNNFIYGVGMAPAAEVLAQDKMSNASDLCRQTATERGPSGSAATIQNNSWGKGTRNPMDYTSEEAAYDRLVRHADARSREPVPLTICFSAGNDGSNGLTRPKAAKNLLVTGNSENFRPDISPMESNDIRQVYEGPRGSSHGNCGDGRIRPHVVAPGEWTASAGYDISPGEREYVSDRITWGGGTSGASPKTAGACALLTQWWRAQNAGKTPSPAMLRALVVNGAEPIDTGGPVPNNRQGWGRLNLRNILADDVDRFYEDQAVLLRTFGEVRTWNLQVCDPTKPVKVTLAWTDPPGPVGMPADASPLVNKLALRVEFTGKTYFGAHQHFRDGWSVESASSAYEGNDNLQNVFLKAGTTTGKFRVTVRALNLTTNCLTDGPEQPQQDFALVVQNARVDPSESSVGVAVAVDPAAAGPAKPAAPGDHWEDSPGNSDADLVEKDYWDTAAPASPPPPPPPATSSSTSTNTEDDWWASGDVQWSTSETEKARPAANPEMTRSLKEGVELVTVGGRHRMLGTIDGPTFSETLKKLDAAWDQAGAYPVAVVVVGSGTRITRGDLDILRRLAFRGRLFLVSDHSPVLSFLAQRIERRKGIEFRLARRPEELPALVRDTLAEAAGGRVVGVRVNEVTSEFTVVTKFAFHVVAADSFLSLHIRYPADSGTKEVLFTRPGREPRALNPQALPAGTHVSHDNGSMQIGIEKPADGAGWTGLWIVQVTQPAGASRAVAKVWARGGPALHLSEAAVPGSGSQGESGRHRDEAVVLVSGEPGVSFRTATVEAPRIASTTPVGGEAPRDIVVSARPSRASRDNGVLMEAARDVSAESLSRAIAIPRSSTGAVVLDVPVMAQGTDADGQPFARGLRASVVRLRSRADWRASLAQARGSLLFVSGTVEAVEYRDGSIAALQLRRRDKERKVAVRAPALADELERIGLDRLRGPGWTFGVAGAELVGVMREIPCGPVPNDRGIERPAPDPLRAEADRPDYPQATRFVPAVSFRRGNDRTINRVVIHITDGGANIAGPISWFQNPASGVSAHYIVGQDGEVVQMVHDADIAYHANSANGDSIGIEHCARAPRAFGPNDEGLYPSAIQYGASAALVRWLCDTYSIPIDRDHILGHAEADTRTTHSQCPNAVWDWDYFLQMVIDAASYPPPGE